MPAKVHEFIFFEKVEVAWSRLWCDFGRSGECLIVVSRRSSHKPSPHLFELMRRLRKAKTYVDIANTSFESYNGRR